MSHENTITIKSGNKWVNIPTVHKGKQLSQSEASRKFREGLIKPLGTFNSVGEAVEAAKKRSKSFDRNPLLRIRPK